MIKNRYLMYVIGLLQGMVFYGPIATLYRQAQGVSVLEITIIESISLFLCILLEIPWGVIADKIGYKRTMIICSGLYFVSKIIFWQASGFWWFLFERIMLSIVVSGLSGVDVSILYLSCEKDKSQKAFGIYNSLQMAGLLFAAIIFSSFIGANYKLSGSLTVLSYGLAVVVSLFLSEVKPSDTRPFSFVEFRNLLKSIIKNRHMLQFLLAIAFLSETHQTITVFLNQIQYTICGMTDSMIGCAYIIATLVGVSTAFSAWFTKKLGARLSGSLFFILAFCSCVLLAITKSALLSVGSILLLRLSNSLFTPLQIELQNRQVTSSNRATELSINALIINSVGIGTNLAFGVFAQINVSVAFLFGTGLCLIGLILFLSRNEKEFVSKRELI